MVGEGQQHRGGPALIAPPTDGSGQRQEVTTEDISTSGVRVLARDGLDVGSVVRIATDGEGEAEAVAIVEVVWRDGGSLHAGLRLVETSESWTQFVRARSAPDAGG